MLRETAVIRSQLQGKFMGIPASPPPRIRKILNLIRKFYYAWFRSGGRRYHEMGMEFASRDQWQAAAENFALATKFSQGNPSWQCSHGQALMKLKRWGLALNAFQSALKQKESPSHETRIVAETASGICLMALRRWGLAEAALARAMVLGCQTSKIHFHYGRCLFKLGRLSEAAESLEKSLEKRSDNHKCAALFSEVKSRMDSLPKEIQTFSHIDEDSGPDIDSQEYRDAREYANRGENFMKLRRFSNSAEAYRTAIAIYPAEVSWHVSLADVTNHLEPGSLARPALSDTHLIKYSGKAHDILYVIFSPVKGRHIFGRVDFKGDTLMLCEERLTYYTYNMTSLLSYLRSVIDDNGYQKVCMIGSSKGAYAALWISGWCARELPRVGFLAIAFSPQTQVWPINGNIHDLPSYQKLRKMAEKSITTDEDLQRYGSLKWLEDLRLPNIEGKVIFGACLPRDTMEAERLKDVPHLTLVPIPNFMFHGTAALYTKQKASLRRVLIGADARSADDAYFNHGDSERMVDDFLKTLDPATYTMDALLEAWRRKH
jgi:tetratricopeptide (TPR) repeat protein